MDGSGIVNDNYIWGDFEFCALGGINAVKSMNNEFVGIIENQQSYTGKPGLLLDSSRNNIIGIHFEGIAGSDIKTAATYWGCYSNRVVTPSSFNDQKSAPYFNIELPNGTGDDFIVESCYRAGMSSRFLSAGTSNGTGDNAVYLGPTTGITPALVTDNTEKGVRYQKRLQGPIAAVTYSTSMTIDANVTSCAMIAATNNTAFTINAPTNSVNGYNLTVTIRNTSGDTLGVATWNAAFKLGAAWTQPANGFSRSIDFYYNGTNWIEKSRTAADVSN